MRILFVGMARSVHSASWVRQFQHLGWDLHFFPSDLPPPHAELHGVTCHWDRHRLDAWSEPGLKAEALTHVIRGVRPDVVHAMSISEGGLLALEAKRRLREAFPRWLVGIWGGCLYFYGRLRATAGSVREVLAACDALMVEGQRDVALARTLGFSGPVVVLPAPGGLLTSRYLAWATEPPSRRRLISVRGQQDWIGRAYAALAALGRCSDELRADDYTVVVHQVSDMGVEAAIERQLVDRGVRVERFEQSSHAEFMRLLGRSRICLQAKVGDGLNQTFVEAMLMGAFPIQADHGIQGEWATHGQTALFIDPDSPDEIAAALRRAIRDDALVDAAALANRQRVVEGLDDAVIRPRAVAMYEALAAGTLPRPGEAGRR